MSDKQLGFVCLCVYISFRVNLILLGNFLPAEEREKRETLIQNQKPSSLPFFLICIVLHFFKGGGSASKLQNEMLQSSNEQGNMIHLSLWIHHFCHFEDLVYLVIFYACYFNFFCVDYDLQLENLLNQIFKCLIDKFVDLS